jgi:hypothetical protein
VVDYFSFSHFFSKSQQKVFFFYFYWADNLNPYETSWFSNYRSRVKFYQTKKIYQPKSFLKINNVDGQHQINVGGGRVTM